MSARGPLWESCSSGHRQVTFDADFHPDCPVCQMRSDWGRRWRAERVHETPLWAAAMLGAAALGVVVTVTLWIVGVA